jgi:hypothetical protein
MAKIINDNADFNQLVSSSYSAWRIAAIGAGLGLVYWLAEIVFEVFYPSSTASGMSIIFTSIIGISVMIWQKMVQPLIISVSVGAVLWGLATWFDGLAGLEVAIWCMLLFSISYVLFSGLINYMKLAFALVAIVFIVVATRALTSL